MPINKPPWHLGDCLMYQFFVCPDDCIFKCKNVAVFKKHMIENHETIAIKEIKEEGNIASLSKNGLIDVDQLKRLINTSVQLTKISSLSDQSEDHPKESKTSAVNFDCNSCNLMFNSIKELRDHIKNEHEDVSNGNTDDNYHEHFDDNNDPNYQETDSEASDDEYKPLIKKIKMTKPQKVQTSNNFSCHLCPDKFKSFDTLKTHLSDKHDHQVKEITPTSLTKENSIKTKVRCSHCLADFRSYFYLKNHCEKRHKKLPIKFTKRTVRVLNEFTGQEILEKEEDGEASTYKCDHCDYVTLHHDLRGYHMQKEHHDTSKLSWFKCDRCDYKCRIRRNFLKHQKGLTNLQIPTNTNKFLQIPTNSFKYQQIPSNTNKYHQIPTNTNKYLFNFQKFSIKMS